MDAPAEPSDQPQGDAAHPWLNGLCGAFALAVHERFGHPIAAVVERALKDGDETIIHCFGLLGDGRMMDAAGVSDLIDPATEVQKAYYPGEVSQVLIREFTVEELAAIREPSEDVFDTADAHRFMDARPSLFPPPTERRKFSILLRRIRDEFIKESAGDADPILDAAALNAGWCADFADAAWRASGGDGARVQVVGDDEVGAAEYSHSLLRFDGLFYDAEAPDGVADWRSLPIYVRQQQEYAQLGLTPVVVPVPPPRSGDIEPPAPALPAPSPAESPEDEPTNMIA